MQSVINQTCNDCEQVLLIDKSGNHPEGNVLWANTQFSKCLDKIDGIYVMALDDDGRFIRKNHLEKVKNHILESDFPEVVLVRSHTIKNIATNEYHYLPPDDVWNLDWDNGERPQSWCGNGYNWVVREDVFRAMAKNYSHAPGGDWHFMTSLIVSGAFFSKCDSVGGESMSRGKGKKFEDCYGDYWIKALSRRFGLKCVSEDDWRLQLWRENK